MDYFKVPHEHLSGETKELNLELTYMKEQANIQVKMLVYA
jgi:hypothetical protein